MKMKPYVNFCVEIVEPCDYGHKEQIKDLSGLKHYIDCQGIGRVVSYAILIKRQLYFIADNKWRLTTNNGQDIITDSLKLIVAPKLTYFADLWKYLNKNALGKDCQCVNLENFAQFEQNTPIFFTGQYEFNGSFLPDAPVHKRPLTCRPLTDNDIVINNNMKQLWPVATGNPPIGLVELLNKTTEKVH